MNLSTLVQKAIEEDVGRGDITSMACIPKEQMCTAKILAKQDLVVCGHEVAQEVFTQRGARYHIAEPEGTFVKKGGVVAEITGNTLAVLSGERLALNFLMRLW